jgi:hypothetical protein
VSRGSTRFCAPPSHRWIRREKFLKGRAATRRGLHDVHVGDFSAVAVFICGAGRHTRKRAQLVVPRGELLWSGLVSGCADCLQLLRDCETFLQCRACDDATSNCGQAQAATARMVPILVLLSAAMVSLHDHRFTRWYTTHRDAVLPATFATSRLCGALEFQRYSIRVFSSPARAQLYVRATRIARMWTASGSIYRAGLMRVIA